MEQNPVDEIFINLICFATTSHRQSGDPHLKAKIANAKFESLSLFSLLLLQKVVKPKISFKQTVENKPTNLSYYYKRYFIATRVVVAVFFIIKQGNE